jgi:hypothetical protein
MDWGEGGNERQETSETKGGKAMTTAFGIPSTA